LAALLRRRIDGDGHARSYTGLHQLPDRRRGLRRRYAVHAGLWHGAHRFPGGDARTLYRSIRRLLSLPPETRMPGREGFAWGTAVGTQRASNLHVRDGVDEDEFVASGTRATARWRCLC